MNQSMSSTPKPVALNASSTTSVIMATACLKTSRPAIDIKLRFEAPVGAQMDGEDAAVVARAGLVLGIEHDGAGAVAEQHAGRAVGPVENARKSLGADHQRP